jgi:hypothetical protein
VPSSGSTAPLWILVLAVPAFLHVDLLIASKVLGVSLTIAAAVAARSIVATLTGSRLGAIVAGPAVVLSARMTWASVSGMEVPLYVTLVLVALARLGSQDVEFAPRYAAEVKNINDLPGPISSTRSRA